MSDTFVKDPAASLDYGFDWSDWLVAGETIATSTWIVPDGLTGGTESTTATATSIWLSGGINGTTYGVTNHVVTSAGREDDRSFALIVREATIPAPGLTARTLINRALTLLGTIADGETPSASVAEQSREVLDELVDAWNADRLFLYQQARTVGTFVANQADYSIGLGGDFNLPRPPFVDAVTILDPTTTPAFEFAPLQCFSDQDWARVQDKALTNDIPYAYAVDRATPFMTMTFYPVPSATTYQPVLYTPGGLLASVETLDTPIIVPPGYLQALRYALASELSMIPGFSPAPRGDLGKRAAMAIGRLKSANVQIDALQVDDALLGGGPGYNWRTGR